MRIQNATEEMKNRTEREGEKGRERKKVQAVFSIIEYKQIEAMIYFTADY